MQILTQLWSIQKWLRSQKTFQFYSSSILIVYDARRLHQLIDSQKRSSGSFCDKKSLNKSWPTSPTTPDDKKMNFNAKFENNGGNCGNGVGSGTFFYKKLQRNHSTNNDYEKVSVF